MVRHCARRIFALLVRAATFVWQSARSSHWARALITTVTAFVVAAPVGTAAAGEFHTAHVCPRSSARLAACTAIVVTDSDGNPLASGKPTMGGYGPAQWHTAYNLPTTAPSAQTVAVVDAFDDPNIEQDLATYSSSFGLPTCSTNNGCFKKVAEDGGTSYPQTDANWAEEISLDVETVHAVCENCKILLVEATSESKEDLGAAVNTAARMGAAIVSASYGWPEYSGELADENAYYNHPGTVITASSGDSGYGVLFPASSRYVTSVGGTTLNLNGDNSYRSETAWSGSGSGCSQFIPKPVWQTDSECARRTVADVSADADPKTGAAVYDSIKYRGKAGWLQIGGTSLSAPLVAAVYALAGNASEVNYGARPYADPTQLNDTTTGSNGHHCSPSYLCSAGSGYDGPTGLGSPNGWRAFGFPLLYAGRGIDITGTVGTAISTGSTSISGGAVPYTVNVSLDGSPPGWAQLGIVGRTVTIDGTPDTAGTSSFSIVVTDGHGEQVSIPVSVTIIPSATGTDGCAPTASDWPQYQFDSGHSGINPSSTAISVGAANQLKSSWSASLPGFGSSPVLANGVLYISSDDGQHGHLSAYCALTGTLVWSVATDRLPSNPTVSNGLVFLSFRLLGGLTAFDAASGVTRWALHSDYFSAPTVASNGDLLVRRVVGGTTTSVDAIDAVSGATVWSTPLSRVEGVTTVASDGSAAYLATSDCTVRAFSLNDGSPLWTSAAFGNGYTGPCEFDQLGNSGLVVADGGVYVADEAGVFGFRSADGALIFSRVGNSTGPEGFVVVNGVVYIREAYQTEALSAADGSFLWGQPTVVNGSTAQGWSPPSFNNGVLFAESTFGSVVARNPSNGTILVTLPVTDEFESNLAVVDGYVYFTTDDVVHAYSLP